MGSIRSSVHLFVQYGLLTCKQEVIIEEAKFTQTYPRRAVMSVPIFTFKKFAHFDSSKTVRVWMWVEHFEACKATKLTE